MINLNQNLKVAHWKDHKKVCAGINVQNIKKPDTENEITNSSQKENSPFITEIQTKIDEIKPKIDEKESKNANQVNVNEVKIELSKNLINQENSNPLDELE